MRCKRGQKKGQLTIFIIIAIVIISAILIYLFYPKIKISLEITPKSPSEFIQGCMENEIKNAVEKISSQGRSLQPGHYIMNKGDKVEFLCYTDEYYKTCVMQQPMLKSRVESEVENAIKDKVKDCFGSLKESYEKKGYNTELKEGITKVELIPKQIVSTFDYSLILTKEGTEKYEAFKIILNNNLYELIQMANSILNWEATYGKVETTLYMNYYRWLKIEYDLKSDGTTIYILTNRDKGNKFQFASRSVVWPPGYGV